MMETSNIFLGHKQPSGSDTEAEADTQPTAYTRANKHKIGGGIESFIFGGLGVIFLRGRLSKRQREKLKLLSLRIYMRRLENSVIFGSIDGYSYRSWSLINFTLCIRI